MYASRACLALAAAAALAAALVACGPKAEHAIPKRDLEDAAALPSVAPAIIPPAEAADPAEPPSYEVAIASAAAVRNRALDRCGKQPAADRSRCEREANAAFADARAKLQALRSDAD